jgi:hypothetical protein
MGIVEPWMIRPAAVPATGGPLREDQPATLPAMRVQITLRNGIQLDVEMVDLTTTRSPIENRLTGMKWTNSDVWTRQLHTIELGEIVAIVVTRDRPEATL